MRKSILLILFTLSILLSRDNYKEIKIFNENIDNVSYLHSLGIHIDHIYKAKDYIQFVINEHDINKLIINNVDYEVIHDDLEAFYLSRLDNNYSDRDFELGSMGGYYTFEEIESQLDQLSFLYPNIISQKVSIGLSLEGRNIWAIKISDNHSINENEPEVLYTGLHHSWL